ncbi:MAG TPA: heparan-alpha-glucosaminide N-acetyltransferase domain-containing protein [Micromonospora sp.]|nr:heparan-alpha-glucosaminide N-acetyltransferase domain-containing protein [Micromonospora sp.]
MTQTTLLRPASGVPDDSSASPPPVTSGRASRLVGVDATRGIALLGMIAVHSLYVSDVAGQPTWSYMIFGGRASAGFAVLAGVGIAFMTGRKRVELANGRATAATLGVRALIIAVIGVALAYTDASYGMVILPYYAAMFVLAIPLVLLPTWAVGAVGVATAAGMPVLTHLLLPHLTAPMSVNLSLGHFVDRPVDTITELLITGQYPALPWMAYLCVGLVIGRLALTAMRVVIGLLATGILLGAAAPVASWLLLQRFGGLAQIHAAQPESGLSVAETDQLLTFGGAGTTPTSTWWWLAVDAPHTNTPPDLFGTTGVVIALLGLMLLVGHLTRPVLRGMVAVVQVPLAAAGSMPLTLYTAHIVFINSEHDTYSAEKGFLLQVLAMLLVGLAWRATAGRGPLEGLTAMLIAKARRWAPTVQHRPRSEPPATRIRQTMQGSRDAGDEVPEPAGSVTGS